MLCFFNLTLRTNQTRIKLKYNEIETCNKEKVRTLIRSLIFNYLRAVFMVIMPVLVKIYGVFKRLYAF